ncbi:MAG: FprA family A-type flavoprotein [Bacteroidales bacterium]|jgi:NADH oxidase (H2O-forming)|nr:FprA family A-type flavoprotein [Bacteroidales bacterium]MDD2204785.1 FprA family A-type flavoprotein [Bacteroidales bacterium]MDD3151935.1 FprA family A-type flavoprotein [Bacteroidales bacterium]MDD3914032.1 FprA family A-type flavoprotein [Bacteroidales bacterium]MDD4633882.1 FprA family A-type flavoprotein [Bacteroidales bacterium]
MNEIIKITDSVSWIGILDHDIKTFDVVMTTDYGTTYNSYFINAQKKAIIETSKLKFWDTYKAKILSVVDPKAIDYIILDHTEPDHSGNVANLLSIAPNAKIVGSANAVRYLKDMFDIDFEYIIVKDNDVLDLGDKTLRFFSVPNLHWPDSIYTYLEEDKLLFTCDSFGAHFCNDKMFDDLVGDYSDAFKYYFDVILKPYSAFLLKAIDKIKDLDIATICTGHGPIIRKNVDGIIALTKEYCQKYLSTPQSNYVFMPYVSAYHKTGDIANYVAQGIKEAGDFEVETLDIENVGLDVISEKLTRAKAVLVGSPTINQNILLPVYQLFALINPIRDRLKLCAGFGSYGWSGESRYIIESNLKNLKLDYFEQGMFLKFSVLENRKAECVAFGKAFGEKLLTCNSK